MAAYGALVSVMHIMENLELHPSPPISLHKEHVASLTQKITFLQEFLQDYNPQLDYSTEADPFEARIADAAHEAEDLIESHIVDRILNDDGEVSYGSLYAALERVIDKMALLVEEATAVKHQLRIKSNDLIHTSRLIKLWVAEGFLKPIIGKSLEEAARVYIRELTDRNLVLIHKMGSTGNIKECKIHDLLRDLCLKESKKERFYTVVSRNLSSQGTGYAAQRRIVVSSYEGIKALKSSNSFTRSLIWDLEYPAPPPHSFKLLRIFESRGRKSPARAKFLRYLPQLVNSRLLEISAISFGCKFPSSIWLFWNLQTLIVGHTWEVIAPVDIWYMPHIRHIEFHSLDFHNRPTAEDDNSVLVNLQTLGIVKYFECSEQVVKRMPDIKKLQIFYVGFHGKYCLSNLCSLDKLESLRCQIIEVSRGSLNMLIDFPRSIKKLTLSINRSQCWQEILDKIGELPHLHKLQLEVGTFEKGKWETSEGQFPSLKFLLIRECLGLRFWTAESSHFPCLEHLVLDRTCNLREIPSDFADIPTLCRIDLEYCRVSAVESAKRILEEREELYGEELAFQVQARLSDSKKNIVERLASPNLHFKWTQGQFQSLKLLT